ncbi:hypothetical protein WAI453_007405 [Rhynchosporium graminicola]
MIPQIKHPEHTSSLSADDFPHGPPSSPASNALSDLIDASGHTFEPLEDVDVNVTTSNKDIASPSTITWPLTPMFPFLFGQKTLPLARPSSSSQRTVIIAISGCSSAGKSLLSKLLSKVFSDFKDIPARIIAQDDFFHPKYLQRMLSFTSTEADTKFVERSIRDDELGMYAISKSGVCASKSSNSLATCTAGRKTPLYHVTGPNADCDEAVDFVGLVDVHENLKATGDVRQYGKRSPSDDSLDEFTGLIRKMKEKIGTDHPRGLNFVFVEGFMLLAPPPTYPFTSSADTTDNLFNISDEITKIETLVKRLEDISVELIAKHDIDADLECEREAIEAQIWKVNLASKTHMQSIFDVKLFLVTSKDEAKRRRFKRPIYKAPRKARGCLDRCGRVRDTLKRLSGKDMRRATAGCSTTRREEG